MSLVACRFETDACVFPNKGEMPLHLAWNEIRYDCPWRLYRAAFGFNRGEHGRPAGFRPTVLVCLAAAITMLLMNLPIDTRGNRSARLCSST